MCVHVCECVYMYVCGICVYVNNMCPCMCVHNYVCAGMHAYMYMYICLYVGMYACLSLRESVRDQPMMPT